MTFGEEDKFIETLFLVLLVWNISNEITKVEQGAKPLIKRGKHRELWQLPRSQTSLTFRNIDKTPEVMVSRNNATENADQFANGSVAVLYLMKAARKC